MVNLPLGTWPFDFTQNNYITRIDYDVSNNPIYQAWAQPGSATSDSAWRIVKNTYDVSNRFTNSGFPQVNGNPSGAFSFVWDNRTTYAYS